MMYSFDDEVFNELLTLENRAVAIDEPSLTRVKQWQELFNYTPDQAVTKIKERTANLGRLVIPDELWDEYREDREAQGFDKDAFEHYLECLPGQAKVCLPRPPPLAQGTESATYLMKLEGSLSSLGSVQALTKSPEIPPVEVAEGNTDALFCRVSAQERVKILCSNLAFRPTFVRLKLSSEKNFDTFSKHPTLGIDTTLPQHRLRTNETALPLQDQYPVWYFCYGNLTVPSILSARLGIEEDEIKLVPARITGGVVGSWGGRYRALLDGPQDATVDGFGFLVTSSRIEDILRYYETDNYEVVRCKMIFKDSGEVVPACTFKFRKGFSN